MGFSITSNYAGDHAGQYIGAAMRSSKSIENLTVLENVKYKRNITKVSTSGLIVDATCDFTDAGTVTLTERVLNPKELQINVDLCIQGSVGGENIHTKLIVEERDFSYPVIPVPITPDVIYVPEIFF